MNQTKTKDIKQGLESLVKGIILAENKKTEETYGKTLDEMIWKYGEKLKDPQKFHLYVQFPITKALKLLVSKLYPGVTGTRLSRLAFLFSHYNLFEEHLESIIRSKEGSACEGDKSRWLLECYVRYLTTGETPNMTDSEKAYWKPKFGTGQEWMDFCDSLMKLYYGYFQDYLIALENLISEK